MSPIETVNADEYEGGYSTNINPIILACDTKMDITHHNLLEHKQGFCIICNAEKWGDNRLNDHTKICREKRDKIRAENDKKDQERANKNPIKPTNMYTVLMNEGVKHEEKEMVVITKKGQKRDQKSRKN